MKWKLFILITLCFTVMFSLVFILYAKTGQIDGMNVNVRSGPGVEFDVITQVHTPENYEILEETGNWAKIEMDEVEGWIHQDYYSIEESSKKGNNINHSSKTIKHSVENLYRKKIVIDPGHGDRDTGAIGVSGQHESDYTLKTAKILQEVLEEAGAEVLLTRETDRYVPLTSRTTFANLMKADVFLSIHYNSTPELPTANGIDTYYMARRDKQLAQFVHQEIIHETLVTDRGIEERDLHVLRTNHLPSLLLELGFISNEKEEKNIQSRAHLRAISRGIARGLSLYFQ
ncbi:N-acetylmuramoyl-L-alanine amidase [Gracilibacillus sp. S3-1-1]|uniref:N-acetylmuramoyl-L-alanine amidase n=1 Tax=Gracilibacillus pellucidus TaxID=3095368 RepID=A0ACC6M9Q6_9BACI|nr:N-acetylmuramoyl-L-alanine amidase [Gracilibacillus sp. S3-1-1]MDX8047675.1 N-acetylmuramoyl-L-alanine amidase [Gracilibacillus sp. S3-1-1]